MWSAEGKVLHRHYCFCSTGLQGQRNFLRDGHDAKAILKKGLSAHKSILFAPNIGTLASHSAFFACNVLCKALIIQAFRSRYPYYSGTEVGIYPGIYRFRRIALESDEMTTVELRKARLTVEQCQVLNIGAMQRAGLLKVGKSWDWWLNGVQGTTRLRFTLDGDLLHASFSAPSSTGDEVTINQEFILLSTPAYFGGVRYWLTCPLDTSGRKLRTLYIPPGAQQFGCRKCHNLTYRSCLVRNQWPGYR